MNSKETLELFKAGPKAWNNWASEVLEQSQNPSGGENYIRLGGNLADSAEVVFHRHTFDKYVDFSRFIFPGKVSFLDCVFLETCLFNEMQFPEAVSFKGTRFGGDLNFSRTRFERIVDFTNIEVAGIFVFLQSACNDRAKFNAANFRSRVDFSSALFTGAVSFANTDFRGQAEFFETAFKNTVSFRNSDFWDGPQFTRINLKQADFTDARLPSAYFCDANLDGTNFTNANLDNADFVFSTFGYNTNFQNARVFQCQIHKHALDSMANFGNLSVSARSSMVIVDDVATLRLSFGGFWRLVYLSSLVVFFIPYFAFGAFRVFLSATNSHQVADTIALWEALARYIYNGGIDWQSGYSFHCTFLIFLGTLATNLVRAVIILKTIELERIEDVKGVHADFRLRDTSWLYFFSWNTLASFVRVMGFILIFTTIWTTFHFLQIPVPV